MKKAKFILHKCVSLQASTARE